MGQRQSRFTFIGGGVKFIWKQIDICVETYSHRTLRLKGLMVKVEGR